MKLVTPLRDKLHTYAATAENVTRQDAETAAESRTWFRYFLQWFQPTFRNALRDKLREKLHSVAASFYVGVRALK